MNVLDLLLNLLDLFQATAPLLAVQIEHLELELGHGRPILLVKEGLEGVSGRLDSSDKVQSLGLVQVHKVLTKLIADGVETLDVLSGDSNLLHDKFPAELVDVGCVPAFERDILDIFYISESHENLCVVHHDTFRDFSGQE